MTNFILPPAPINGNISWNACINPFNRKETFVAVSNVVLFINFPVYVILIVDNEFGVVPVPADIIWYKIMLGETVYAILFETQYPVITANWDSGVAGTQLGVTVGVGVGVGVTDVGVGVGVTISESSALFHVFGATQTYI